MIYEPIIIIENGDISIFKSLDKVYSYLEIIDIENNEYLAFDSKGLSLDFQIIGENKKYFNFLESEYNIEKLSFEIIQFLNRLQINKEFENLTLSELINLLIDEINYTE